MEKERLGSAGSRVRLISWRRSVEGLGLVA